MSKKRRSGGFLNRNKPDTQPEAENQEQTSAPPARRPRSEEPLLHETVWETTVDICNANPLFIVTRDDEKFFVGLYMPFSEIGGLSKKDAKQESKGSIVGQINHGQISVMNTQALIEKNAVVFLPTESTLSNMAEFSLLGDTANYEYCFINADTGELELTGIKTKLAGVQELHMDGRHVGLLPSIRKLVDAVDEAAVSKPKASGSSSSGPISVPSASSDSGPVAVPPAMQEMVLRDDDEDDEDERTIGEEDIPTGEEAMYGSVEDDSDGSDFENEEPVQQESSGPRADDEFSGDMLSDAEDDLTLGSSSDAVAPDVEYTAEDTQRALRRKFFNDNLDEELTTAPLDQALADVIPFKPIPYKPSGWLNEQINARLVAMNQELNQLHQSNLAQVRQRYLDGIVQAYLDTMSAVEAFDSSDEYKSLKESKDTYLENSTADVEKRREALKEEFEKNAKDAGEQARSEAEHRYRERYHWELEQRLAAVESEVVGSVEASFEVIVAKKKQAIRQEKMTELDTKHQELIEACCDQFAKLMEDEEALRKVHEEGLQQFLEDNRKDEVTRTQALLEEQSRDDRVARIQKEYEGHVAELKKEFDALAEAHKHNLQTLREHHADELTAQENVHRRDVAIYASDNQRQQSRIDQLTSSLTELDEKKNQEYAAKISELEAQRDAVEAKYQDVVNAQRKGNRLMIAIAAITAMLFLAVGVLIGQFVFSNLAAERELIDDLHSQYVETLPEDTTGGEVNTDGQDVEPVVPDETENPVSEGGEPAVSDDVVDETTGETEPVTGEETTPEA